MRAAGWLAALLALVAGWLPVLYVVLMGASAYTTVIDERGDGMWWRGLVATIAAGWFLLEAYRPPKQ